MRPTVRLVVVAALCGALALAAPAVVHADLPKPAGPINDFAGVLSADDAQSLARLAAEVEQATGAEIAVATVTSLDGLTVEDYATRLFAAWGVGQRGTDNGVLIVVAPGERAMRIEVGYGLEGILPDGLAGQIVRETFLPAFRDGNYGRGIVEGTTRVAGIIRRNQPVTDAQLQALAAAQDGASSNDAVLPYVFVPFLGVFVGLGFGFAGAGLGARVAGPMLLGFIFGGVPLGLSWLVGMPVGARILAGVALIAFIAGVVYGRRPKGRASMRGSAAKPKGRWMLGGGSGSFGSTGSSRSSGGSSSSGSSGSFGGGSSGGGGASGRW